MKLNNPKTILAALLLLTTSFAHATPTIVTFDGWWGWIFPEVVQPLSSEVCESFPDCPPPPFAPTPAEPTDQEKK
jgi:hypothetical protein